MMLAVCRRWGQGPRWLDTLPEDERLDVLADWRAEQMDAIEAQRQAKRPRAAQPPQRGRGR